jgi:hypothetical protein
MLRTSPKIRLNMMTVVGRAVYERGGEIARWSSRGDVDLARLCLCLHGWSSCRKHG